MTGVEQMMLTLKERANSFKEEQGEKFVTICNTNANNGDMYAQMLLGAFYTLTIGVPQNYIRAHMWFNIAASNGDDECIDFRDYIETRMGPNQVERAQDLAVQWLKNRSTLNQ